MREIILGGLVGHAVGDALGASVEFQRRDKLRENPVTDMRPVRTSLNAPDVSVEVRPPGTWSDDTSMTLAFVDSLLSAEKYDADDVMRRFSNGTTKVNTDLLVKCGIAAALPAWQSENLIGVHLLMSAEANPNMTTAMVQSCEYCRLRFIFARYMAIIRGKKMPLISFTKCPH